MTNTSISKKNHSQIIKYPLITDKATRLIENNQYTFIVERYADKTNIKSAIEYLFNVKVIKINICCLPRKKKRVGKYTGYKPQYKKAIIRLAQDDMINLFTEN